MAKREEPAIARAEELLERLGSFDEIRRYYEAREMAIHDEVTRLTGAKAEGIAEGIAKGRTEGRTEGRAEGRIEGRIEGIAEGRIEGIAEGRIEGIAEGRVEGISEGERKKALQIARSLLDILNDTVISEKTGLPIEEVAKLRNQ